MTIDASVHEELDELLLPWDDVSTWGMFGGRGYFVGGRLFVAFYGGIANKLPDQDLEEALNRQIASPFTPVLGRRFGTWVRLPLEYPDGVQAFPPWLRKAYKYDLVTPPKRRKW